MRWRTKAAIQNTLARLPSAISYDAYYWIQRKFGALRRVDPTSRISDAVESYRLAVSCGIDAIGSTVFEVGTGRIPMAPLSYWMMGARRVITVDLNPYAKTELLQEALAFVDANLTSVREIFGDLLLEDRLDELMKFRGQSDLSADSLFDRCGIEYLAPGDAAGTNLPDDSIDLHTSQNVFEHISATTLADILTEGNRIVSDSGVFVHKIDYSDHFAHSDRTISPINFLRFSDDEWNRLAGNRYMYMNRLRHDDFLRLFESCHHEILHCSPAMNDSVRNLVESNALIVDDKFGEKTPDILSITGATVVSRRKCSREPRS